MAVKTLGQSEIDELFNSIDDLDSKLFTPPARLATDIRTFKIPFIASMSAIKVLKVKERYLVVIRFDNNKYLTEYFDSQVIVDDIFTYDMKQYMYLSIPYMTELDSLTAHSRTSWTIDEADRIKIKYKE